jgi:hypothetical protein
MIQWLGTPVRTQWLAQPIEEPPPRLNLNVPPVDVNVRLAGLPLFFLGLAVGLIGACALRRC